MHQEKTFGILAEAVDLQLRLALSSSPAVPKPEFSFSTFKDEPGEYVEIPSPPEITLSGLQDWESKLQPWELHDSTGNGLLPSKLDKRKK